MTPSQRVSLMLQKFRKPEVTQRNVDQPKVCHVFPQRKSAPRTLKKPSGFAGGPESFLQTPAAKRSLFAKEQIDFEKSISGISRHAYARNLQDSYKKQEAVIPNCFSATAATRTKHLDIDNASGQRLDPRDKLRAQPEHQKTLSQVAHQHSENRGFEPSGFELGKTSLAFESPTTFETPFFNRLRPSSDEKDESFTSPGQELGFGATQDRHQQPRPSFENVGGYKRDGGSSDGGNISRKQLFAPSHTATSAHRAANEETYFGHSPQTAPQVGGEQQSGQFSRSGH